MNFKLLKLNLKIAWLKLVGKLEKISDSSDFSSISIDSPRILIILPIEQELISKSMKCISGIIDSYKSRNAKFSFIINNKIEGKLNFYNIKTLTLNISKRGNVNNSKKILDEIYFEKYDIIIDLNINFSFEISMLINQLRSKYKVNVMFHKDYFKECIDVCEKLEKNGVDFVPRIIGDEENDEKAIELGYAHRYNREQMKWFRNYWKQKGQNVTEKGNSQAGLGRPCCGGRCFKADGVDTYFLPSTNFVGWNCMVNWYFLFINSEADRVWTHQTCGVNLDGEVAPLGKISEFDKIIDSLEHELYVHNRIPMITCPKTFCGCGMCVTKTSQNIEPMFTKHVVDDLTYEIVSQKESNWETDLTTKKVFEELDAI